MILIHTALQSEAQYFIEKLKLKKCNLSPKIFCDERIVLVVSGIGNENTFKSLEFVKILIWQEVKKLPSFSYFCIVICIKI